MAHQDREPLLEQLQPVAPHRRRLYALLAEGTLLAHFGFILLAVGGGLLLPLLPGLIWLHVPVVLWSALVNLLSWTCPLTPLEKHFRRRAGMESYEGGFIFHHIGPLVYPGGMPRQLELVAGFSILAWNGLVYGGVFLLAW